jgi:hypothetical protein
VSRATKGASGAGLNWDVTREDAALIRQIADRAIADSKAHGMKVGKGARVDIAMDIEATHLNGCPIRLADLLAADDFNFWHDVRLETLYETRLLIQGSSGAGKTQACFHLLEETHGHVQQIVIDREGEFGKLREQFDYLILGADGEKRIPMRKGALELQLHRVLELQISAIYDLSDLVPLQQQHVLLDSLGDGAPPARIRLWDPMRLVLIDEAQWFAPQTGKAESLEALIELASLGRKRGFCPIAAGTRVAMINKSFTELLENKLIGRAGTNDSKRAARSSSSTSTAVASCARCRSATSTRTGRRSRSIPCSCARRRSSRYSRVAWRASRADAGGAGEGAEGARKVRRSRGGGREEGAHARGAAAAAAPTRRRSSAGRSDPAPWSRSQLRILLRSQPPSIALAASGRATSSARWGEISIVHRSRSTASSPSATS